MEDGHLKIAAEHPDDTPMAELVGVLALAQMQMAGKALTPPRPSPIQKPALTVPGR